MPNTEVLPAHGPIAPERLLPGSPLSALIIVVLIGVVADQASKVWAFAPPPGPARTWEAAPGLITGIPSRNDGAVANLASGRPMTATICGDQRQLGFPPSDN